MFLVISCKIKMNSFIMFTSVRKIITVKADCLSLQSSVNTFPWHCCSVMTFNELSQLSLLYYVHFHSIVNSIFHYKNPGERKSTRWRKRENEVMRAFHRHTITHKRWKHFSFFVVVVVWKMLKRDLLIISGCVRKIRFRRSITIVWAI